PGGFAPPGAEAQRHRLAQGAAGKVPEQQGPRGIIRAESAAVDVAVAVAMLQGNLPLPARIAAGDQGVWIGRRGAAAVHEHGPIAGQPSTPILITRTQGSLDEQALKAAAVDEE